MKVQDKTMKFKIRFILLSVSYVILISGLISVIAYQEFSNDSGQTLGSDQPNYQISHLSASGKGGKLFSQEENGPSRPFWLERLPRSIQTNNIPDIPISEKVRHKPKSIKNIIHKNKNIKDKPNKNQNHLEFVQTATPKTTISLDDVFISVKTTGAFHKSRLDIIIKTWFNMARKQTWFFTDVDSPEYQSKTGNHMVNTNCQPSHDRQALCCKMAREFDAFVESSARWWCHFDDDNYVNIPGLLKTLTSYDPMLDWYLGRPSIRAPLEILNKDNLSEKIAFWFATGGAGFCVSRSLALKMLPIAGGGRFISVGEKIRLPDDVTMGYIIEHMLGKKLTVAEEFHSHLEPMKLINLDTLNQQISLSYSKHGRDMNVLNIPGLPEEMDSTRLYSLHCRLFPTSSNCSSR